MEIDEGGFFERHPVVKKVSIASLLLVFIVSVAGAIVIKTVVPGTVQSAIDDSSITFGQTNVTNPADDGSTFDLYAEIVVTCEAPLAVTIQDVELTFTYDDVVVGYATLPAIHLNKGDKEKAINPSATFTLHDAELTGWNYFAHDLVMSDDITWHVSGLPTVEVEFPVIGKVSYRCERASEGDWSTTITTAQGQFD